MTDCALRVVADVRVPTLPILAARLVALCEKEDYSTAELVRLVETDPGVTSRLLRLANSAYYGFRRKIATLGEAVVLLGRVTVEAMALGASIFRAWRGLKMPAAAEDLWVHSYLCALGCRYLAQRLSPDLWRSGAETLFLTGLLHDLGKIFFLAQEPDNYLGDLEKASSGADLLLFEEARFGCDHAEAGGAALDRWDFPPAIATVVRYHHAGGLRAELRADWEILQAVDGALGVGLTEGTSLPEALISDLTAYLELGKAEARAIYQSIL